MAIQVSYLESKLYPEWVKTAAGTVSSFKGNFTYPATITPEEVKSSGALPPTPGPPDTDAWAELSQIYFEITIDGKPLGRWAKIEGLSMKIELAEFRTGDGDNYRWYEPSFTTFTNVTLTRAASKAGTAELLAWLQYAQFGWKRGMTAQITARPLWRNNSELWKLFLGDVIPVAYKGPAFNSEGKLATESLELAHSGFVDPHGSTTGGPPTGMPALQPRPAFTPPAPPPPRTLSSIAEAGGSTVGG